MSVIFNSKCNIVNIRSCSILLGLTGSYFMAIENGNFLPAGSEATRFLLVFFFFYYIALQSWMAIYKKDFF